nr:MAG TPA: hypothetical protein [Caudoviricetes sp.]
MGSRAWGRPGQAWESAFLPYNEAQFLRNPKLRRETLCIMCKKTAPRRLCPDVLKMPYNHRL